MFGDTPTPFKNEATRYLESYAGSNMYRHQGYSFQVIEPLVYQADKISLVMEAKELLTGNAWETIARSVNVAEEDLEDVEDEFLEKLINICEYKKDAFRPGGEVHSAVISLMSDIQSIEGDNLLGLIFEEFVNSILDIEV
jgi:hypothetical protein